MTPRRGRAVVVAMALVAAAAVAACGVPTTDGAERINSGDLPVALLEPTTTTTTTTSTTTTTPAPTSTTRPPASTTTEAPTTTTVVQAAPLTIWLVRDGALVQVGRPWSVEPGAPTPGVDEALQLLDAGATEDEIAGGTTSALPSSGLFRLAEAPSFGRAVVILRPAFFEEVVDDQSLAFGQIVYTITGAPNAGVSQVAFVREEDPATPIQVLSGDGQLIDFGQREDYSSITTPSTPSTPSSS